MIKNPTIDQDVWYIFDNTLNRGTLVDYTSKYLIIDDTTKCLGNTLMLYENVFATQKQAIAYWEKDTLRQIKKLLSSKLYDSVNGKNIKLKLKKFWQR